MSDLTDRIRGDESPMQRILDWVPGFKGYRDQQQRREGDRLVRDHLVSLLSESHDKVRKATGDLAKQAKLKHMSALDSISKRIEKLTDLIRYADAGYSGWFAAVKIKEDELDRLYEYDVSLTQFIGDVQAAVEEVMSASEDDLADAVGKVDDSLDELEHMVKNREKVALDLVP